MIQYHLKNSYRVPRKNENGYLLFINRKGAIPYEMIAEYNSLDIVPDEGEFFLPHHFYSNLKDTTMSDEEYQNVKKNYKK